LINEIYKTNHSKQINTLHVCFGSFKGLASLSSSFSSTAFKDIEVRSEHLKRVVKVAVLLPLDYNPGKEYPLILFNDAQDFGALRLCDTYLDLLRSEQVRPAIVAGIYANERRLYEYGTAAQPDYAGRGSEAGATTAFVTEELIPLLSVNLGARRYGNVYAGFSLGGLMALDIVINHPSTFSLAGVFSGALWWRQKAIGEGYSDSDRIMHAQIRSLRDIPDTKFWFQCGSLDEYDDRDGDGVIDSVQDTLECIGELERKGYVWNKDVFYIEVGGGQHNQSTWAVVLPEFLKWASHNLR
jgi:enterochelin esterase-like enzyme